MAINCRYDVGNEGYELEICLRGFTRREQIDTRVGAERPVVVLARSVDALEGFFVQQNAERVATCHLLHQNEQQLVVVVGEVHLLIDRSQLELVGCHLVMACLDRNTELQRLALQVLHKFDYAVGNRTEIVVLQLLVFGALVSHQRTTRQHQIGTCSPQSLIDQEILLLPTQVGGYALDVGVEVVAHVHRSLTHSRDRAQQGELVVESLARICDENGWDTECCIDNEGGRCCVPSRVAARLEGVADTAIGERRCVGFLLNEQLARELFEHTSHAVVFEECVVLFGRTARQRLKPVRVVCSSLIHSPLLHSRCDFGSDLTREWRTVVHRVEHSLVGLFVEITAHCSAVENLRAEVFRGASFGCLGSEGLTVDSLLDHSESER